MIKGKQLYCSVFNCFSIYVCFLTDSGLNAKKGEKFAKNKAINTERVLHFFKSMVFSNKFTYSLLQSLAFHHCTFECIIYVLSIFDFLLLVSGKIWARLFEISHTRQGRDGWWTAGLSWCLKDQYSIKEIRKGLLYDFPSDREATGHLGLDSPREGI